MRLDRLLTLYFFHPLSGILRSSDGTRISILMYHGISERDEDVPHPYYVTNTRPEVFARQMQFLADNDYNVISLSEAISLLSIVSKPQTGSPAAKRHFPKPEARQNVVITFDDGHRDYHDVAWPILKKFGYPATMFLPTGFVDNERKRLNGKECLTWDEVEALAAQGAMFGAHTVSHIQLYGKDSRKIDYEINQSKREIEEKLHGRVEHYAYALAFPEHDMGFVQNLQDILRQVGFTGAVSTRIGIAKQGDDLYLLKRIPVNSHDDEGLLRAKLEGGYDWLHQVQAYKKKMRFAG